MKTTVCLVVGPQATSAFVPDYPGCWVLGQTRESALNKVKPAIEVWFNWVQKHGENPENASEGIDIEVAEMLSVDYNPAEARVPEPLFWSEVLPINEKDIERTIRLMDYSRQDLLDLVRNRPEESFEWKPPGKPRTIHNCLEHIAHVDAWYITRLNIDLPDDFPAAVFDLLGHTRSIVIDVLKNFPPRKMSGVFQPRKYKSPVCNLWTARKVLRRLVDHERLHTKYIQTVLEMYYNR